MIDICLASKSTRPVIFKRLLRFFPRFHDKWFAGEVLYVTSSQAKNPPGRLIP